MKMLRLDRVSKSFKVEKQFIRVVDEVSLEIRQGQIVGLQGRSGCGKSTLSKLVLGLLEMDSGSIYFDDRPVEYHQKDSLGNLRKKCALIFQHSLESLNPVLSADEHLREILSYHRLCKKDEMRARIDELMHVAGFPADLKNQKPVFLSQGECQRLCIARALALKPDFLICDEITASLDASMRARILNLLLELRQKDMGILYISHDHKSVEHICDRVYTMNAGKVSLKEKVFS